MQFFILEVGQFIQKTDRAFFEGLAMTGSSTNQKVAATAVRQAAIDMLGQFGYSCADINTMTLEFNAAGYTLAPYDCAFIDHCWRNEIVNFPPLYGHGFDVNIKAV